LSHLLELNNENILTFSEFAHARGDAKNLSELWPVDNYVDKYFFFALTTFNSRPK